MLLCDIGNTSYHFQDENHNYRESVKTFFPQNIQKRVYFISVNQELTKVLKNLDNWIDLSSFIDKKKYYETMGIDRIFAIEAVKNGVIFDAGSAITVDVVKDGFFEGGFIYPGHAAMRESYKNISPALNYSFNFELELDIMPKNSQDAISYGYLKTLYCEIVSYKLPITLTGGDAQRFQRIFKDAKVDEELIFNGMKKIIKRAGIC